MIIASPFRDISRMITGIFFLFVTAFVFFINNNHSEIFKRCKNRRTRADDNFYLFPMNF